MGRAQQEGLTGFVQGLTFGLEKRQEEERERRRRREELVDRLELLVASKRLEQQFPQTISIVDPNTGEVRNVQVPGGSSVIQGQRLLPEQQLKGNILSNLQEQQAAQQRLEGALPSFTPEERGLFGQGQFFPASQAQAQIAQQAQEQLRQAQQRGLLLEQQAGTLQRLFPRSDLIDFSQFFPGQGGGFTPQEVGMSGVTQQSPAGDTVTIQLPDGSIATIPRGNLQEALRRGARLVQ